jgi:hypothetical protein
MAINKEAIVRRGVRQGECYVRESLWVRERGAGGGRGGVGKASVETVVEGGCEEKEKGDGLRAALIARTHLPRGVADGVAAEPFRAEPVGRAAVKGRRRGYVALRDEGAQALRNDFVRRERERGREEQ